MRGRGRGWRWFGHIERMENKEFVEKVYLSSVEDPNRRGRPLGRWEDRVKAYGRWEDRVKAYVNYRGVRGNGLKWAGRECMDRERWRFVCHGNPPPLGGCFRRE